MTYVSRGRRTARTVAHIEAHRGSDRAQENARALVGGWLAGFGGNDADVARFLCDRHPVDRVAVTVIDENLRGTRVTFGELSETSKRVAAGLAELGVGPGDRVATLLGKSVELVTTLIATWRLGAVHVPLPMALSPAAIEARLADAAARVVVCDTAGRSKLGASGPPVRSIVNTDVCAPPGDIRYASLLAQAPVRPHSRAMGGRSAFIQIYTSTGSGRPSAVRVPVEALAGFRAYHSFGLDVRDSDVFWNAADPALSYGLYGGVCGPFAAGHGIHLLQGTFTPARTAAALARFGITNFAAPPSVYRVLRTELSSLPPGLRLRRCSSAGEPLDAATSDWARYALGAPIADHYGQTELGMLLGNHHNPMIARPIVAGSVGQAMPGWDVTVLREDADEPVPPMWRGRLAVGVDSPLMWFNGYGQEPCAGRHRFSDDGRWYLTGDVASVDIDGNFYLAGPADDVISVAGTRVGPAEVEAALLAHPGIADAAVVGVPTGVAGEQMPMAFVVLRRYWHHHAQLESELQALVADRVSAPATPRRVTVVNDLPRSPGGKIQRHVLRERADRSSPTRRGPAVRSPMI